MKREIFSTTGILSDLDGNYCRINSNNNRTQDFSWRRVVEDLKLDIIGINCISDDNDSQGNGIYSASTRDFIEKHWDEESSDIRRIILVHHNLFPSVTESSVEEKSTLTKSGDLIKIATRKNCQIILSGHSHSPSIFKFSFKNLGSKNDGEFKNVINISSGTSGGLTPSLDDYKSFNIIELIGGGVITSKVRVTPVFYNSKNQTWEKGEMEAIQF